MSKWDKLIQRIQSLSKDLRFEELQKILENYGYEMKGVGSGSSHFTFRKPGCAPITVPKKYPIPLTYVKMIKEIIESQEDTDENA